MKLSVLQEELLRGLSLCSRFVSTRAQLPVLSNILFSTEKGKLVLSATNLEMGVSIEVGAKTEKEGKITVPSKMVVELVSNMPAGKVSLEDKKGQLFLSTPTSYTTLSGIPATEFPLVPTEIKKKDFSLEKDTLQSISNQVTFSAATDESRPVLTGTLLLFGNKLRAVSTDGFRLSLKEISLNEAKKTSKKLLMPARAISEMARTIGDRKILVGVSILEKEGQVVLSADPVTLTGKILEGEFPDYDKVLPKENSCKAVVAKEELARAVRSASVFAREAASIVRLKIGKGTLVVSAESPQYGKEKSSIEAKTEGKETEAAFNYRYVLEFLGSVLGEDVSFETEGPTSPGVFKDTKDPSYTHLIMPVRIQS